MERLTEEKIILVTRPTRLAELKRRFNTIGQARFYISHLGEDFSDYENEDAQYESAVGTAQRTLETVGRVQVIDRSFLTNFVFGPRDVVVVLGQDGLVANTVKYLNGQPVVGVNPDPSRWDGQLLPFQVRDLEKIILEVIQGRRPTKAVTMARAALNTGEVMHAVNDLFIGPRSHGSARYSISIGGHSEPQSSSGVIVSTGLGSTGWFKSLLTGAVGITSTAGPAIFRKPRKETGANSAVRPAEQPVQSQFPWDADYLYFTVREPFPSKTTKATIVFGRVTGPEPLVLVSQMPEQGVIFSDGIEQDFLNFRSGTRAVVGLAEKQGRLVV